MDDTGFLDNLMVVANAVSALAEINANSSPTNIWDTSHTLSKLRTTLNECWVSTLLEQLANVFSFEKLLEHLFLIIVYAKGYKYHTCTKCYKWDETWDLGLLA